VFSFKDCNCISISLRPSMNMIDGPRHSEAWNCSTIEVRLYNSLLINVELSKTNEKD
jgi:hypothetical protein